MNKHIQLVLALTLSLLCSHTIAGTRATVIPAGNAAQPASTNNTTNTNQTQNPPITINVTPNVVPYPYPPNTMPANPPFQTSAPYNSSPSTIPASAQPSQPSQSTLADADITTNIQAKIMSDTNLIGANIRVRTSNGLVILEGTANSQTQVDTAIQYAKSVPGVNTVNSQVTLPSSKTTVPVPSPSQ